MTGNRVSIPVLASRPVFDGEIIFSPDFEPSGVLPYWFWRFSQPCECRMVGSYGERPPKKILFEVLDEVYYRQQFLPGNAVVQLILAENSAGVGAYSFFACLDLTED